MQWFFYHTEGCHLCDEAYALLKPLIREGHIKIEPVDIIDDESLFALFATSIPVVKDQQSGQLLAWPFDERQVIEFIQGCMPS